MYLKTLLIFLTLAGFVVACNSTSNSQKLRQSEQDTTNAHAEKQLNRNHGGKMLVAYFSHSGNTRYVAKEIAELTGADIFEIKSTNIYSTNYNEVVEQAKKEKQNNFKPILANKLPNVEAYDTIFLGYPNWWGTMPMAVFSFLEEYKLDGKTIVPFCTHEGSRMGNSEGDIIKTCPKVYVSKGLAIRGSSVESAEDDILKWLKENNISLK